MHPVIKKVRLPSKTLPRIVALVQRSQPSTERPRMAEDVEARLDHIERDTAACYASMEEVTHQTLQAAKALGEDD